MKVYLASSLHNVVQLQAFRDQLRAAAVQVTYEWFDHGYIENPQSLAHIAQAELNGVLSAEIFILIQPGRKGTYFEFGVAYNAGKRIIMVTEAEPTTELTSFNYLPGLHVVATPALALDLLLVWKGNVDESA